MPPARSARSESAVVAPVSTNADFSKNTKRRGGLRCNVLTQLVALFAMLGMPTAWSAEIQLRSTLFTGPSRDQTRILISDRLHGGWFGSLEMGYAHEDWRWERPLYVQPQLRYDLSLTEGISVAPGVFWLRTESGHTLRPFLRIGYSGIEGWRFTLRYRYEQDLYRSKNVWGEPDRRTVHRLDAFVDHDLNRHLTIGYEGAILVAEDGFRFSNRERVTFEHGLKIRLNLSENNSLIGEAAHVGTYYENGSAQNQYRLRIGVTHRF